MMRSRSRQDAHLTFHPIVIASAVVFVVLFLALGYHTGVSQVEWEHELLLRKVTEALEPEKKKLATCFKQLDAVLGEVHKADSHVRALRKEVQERDKEQEGVHNAYKSLDKENTKCEVNRTEVEERIRNFSREDEERRRTVEETEKEVDALQVSILYLTRGDGMSVALLDEVLRSLRASYAAKCHTTPGCVELTDEDLLQLRVEEHRSEEEIKAFLERDAAAQKSLANSLQGPSANLSGMYFLPTVAEEPHWDAKAHYPKYFRRGINQKPLRGAKNSSAPVLTAGNVVQILETYSDYAMCAYRRKNSKFTFESFFAYIPGDTAAPAAGAAASAGVVVKPTSQISAKLHKLIVSPLLRYCLQCNTHKWKQQYRLACFKNRMLDLANYGTNDFWVVRSMIQAAPSVQTAALNFYESHEAEKQRVLAVVLHLFSEKDREDCDRAATQEYGIHYQYLTSNFPNDASLKQHVAADYNAQCSPTPAQIIEQIRNVCAAAENSFKKIYLSMSAEMRSNVLALMKETGDTELQPLLMPAFADPVTEKTTPGFTELVDLEIASRATDILVSPFMRASRYVTEEFLLRHRLNPSGHIWVF